MRRRATQLPGPRVRLYQVLGSAERIDVHMRDGVYHLRQPRPLRARLRTVGRRAVDWLWTAVLVLACLALWTGLLAAGLRWAVGP